MNTLKLNTTYKDILRFAIPISFSILIPQINYFTNNVFLSQLGENELGTGGITGVYYLVFAVIGFGFNNGLQSILSRSAGAENIRDIGRFMAQAMRMILFLAIFGIAFTYLLSPLIFKNQISSDQVLAATISFIKIRILGLPFLYAFQLGNSFLISTNNTRFLAIGALTEALTNIFLDYALIFGHFGFPELGFNGAAWASVGAEVAGMVVIHGFLIYKKLLHRFHIFEYKKWDKKAVYDMAERSSPLILQYLISVVSWLLFYLWIEHLGQRSLAISNTMRNVFGLFGVVIWALASTSNNMVSNLLGQRREYEVIALIKKIARLSLMITLGLCLLLNLAPSLFFSMYRSDPDFVAAAVPVLRTVSIGLIGMSQGAIWLNAISGTGFTKINLLIEIVTVLAYLSYVYFVVFIQKLSLSWAWASEIVYWNVLFLSSLSFFYFYPWQKKLKLKDQLE